MIIVSAIARITLLIGIVFGAAAAQAASAPDAGAPAPAPGTSTTPGSAAPEPASAASAAEPSAAQQAAAKEATDAALGAKVFAELCVRCHDAPDPASRSRRQWNAIALHMRTFADLSREDEQRVLAFLRRFSTATMSHENGAPASR